MRDSGPVVHVAGTGLAGAGYPNAGETIRILREKLGVEVVDHSAWLPPGTTLWRKAAGLGGLLFLLRLVLVNAREALRTWRVGRAPGHWVFAPYPSVFYLWWLSWVPRSLRPRVVADAYVSLWDAAFRDRGMGSESGLASRLVRRFEARALRAAATVHVDTIANRDWFVARFNLDPGRVRAIPLAIRDPGALPATQGQGRLRVLFLGTLVPLHGVSVIAGAIRRLADMGCAIDFVVAGDGQDRGALDALSSGPDRGAGLTWIREWQDEKAVAGLVRGADVCLGVFGGSGKAARVLPFKVYLALAAGKPLVTQASYSLPEGAAAIPAITVVPECEALAEALAALAGEPSRLQALGTSARAYYQQHLGADRIAEAWARLLAEGKRRAG